MASRGLMAGLWIAYLPHFTIFCVTRLGHVGRLFEFFSRTCVGRPHRSHLPPKVWTRRCAPPTLAGYTNKPIGYRRMTDEIAKLIVVKFNEQPSAEIIARLKEAGFRFRPEPEFRGTRVPGNPSSGDT